MKSTNLRLRLLNTFVISFNARSHCDNHMCRHACAKYEMNASRDTCDAAECQTETGAIVCAQLAMMSVNAFKRASNKNIKMNVPPTEFFVCHCHSYGKTA